MATPAPTRSQLQELPAVASPDVEARWTLERDSPILTSWVFMDWDVPAYRRIVTGNWETGGGNYW